MKQAVIAFPERVEIIQMADVPGCYDVYCDYSDGSCEALNPSVSYSDDDSPWTYYVAGLKIAVLASLEKWGDRVEIILSRHRGAPHRPPLLLWAGR